MARLLLTLCALTALFAASLIVALVVGQTEISILKILACVLLIDQSVVTIVFILAKRLGPSFRIVVLVGAVGISIGGLLLIVQNAMTWESSPQILISVLGAAAIVQGAFTLWQIARTRETEGPK